MVVNITDLSKEELVTLNPLLKRNKILSLVVGTIVLVFAIASLFMDDYNTFSTIMFFCLAGLQYFTAFFSEKLALRRKGLPESVTYTYTFNEDDINIKMTGDNMEHETVVLYSNISKYKFIDNVHYVYVNKYLYYTIKDTFSSEDDRNFFIGKVNVNGKK